MAIWLASFLGKYQIFIDFHNYGFTILNLNIKNRTVIKLAKLYEQFFARKANKFFCVSDLMRADLKANWNI
jgi:beta-1,4-mannosyltransferase